MCAVAMRSGLELQDRVPRLLERRALQPPGCGAFPVWCWLLVLSWAGCCLSGPLAVGDKLSGGGIGGLTHLWPTSSYEFFLNALCELKPDGVEIPPRCRLV